MKKQSEITVHHVVETFMSKLGDFLTCTVRKTLYAHVTGMGGGAWHPIGEERTAWIVNIFPQIKNYHFIKEKTKY